MLESIKTKSRALSQTQEDLKAANDLSHFANSVVVDLKASQRTLQQSLDEKTGELNQQKADSDVQSQTLAQAQGHATTLSSSLTQAREGYERDAQGKRHASK